MAPALSDLEDRINFDRNAEGEGIDADGGAGVSAAVSEDGDDQIRSPVHNLWLADEIRRAVDKTAEPDATHYPAEVAAAGVTNESNYLKRAGAGRLLSLLNIKLLSEFADEA